MAKNVPTILVASAARITSDVSSAVEVRAGLKALAVVLDVTNADTDAGDTLNVRIQTTFDNVNYSDIASFAQVIGTAAAGKQEAIINCEVAPTTPLQAPTAGSLAAGSILQGPIGPQIRAAWAIVNFGTADASFTFGVTVLPIH